MSNESTESELKCLLERQEHNAALALAFKRYGQDVFGYLMVLLREQSLAEEAYSMFTEALVRGIRTYKQQCPFRAWAYIVAKNEAARALRRRRVLLPLGSTLAERLPAPSCPSSSGSLQERRLDCIRASLSDEERELLVLRVDRNLPWEEVAAIMSTPTSTVSANGLVQRFSRLKRRLKRVRDELPEACGRPDCVSSEWCSTRNNLVSEARSV